VVLVLGFIIYAKRYLEFNRTTGPDGSALSVSHRRNTETVNLVSL